MQTYQLAQANIARMLAPPDDPALADFVARLDEINALAERSPGFIWRYVSDARKSTDREFDDPLLLFNMSVWDSVEALYDYAYRSAHAQVYARRGDWFDKMTQPQFVLWWVAAGTVPTVAQAKERLDLLAAAGPGPRAFTFRARYAPDGSLVAGKKPQPQAGAPA
jgi:hypothetical protein